MKLFKYKDFLLNESSEIDMWWLSRDEIRNIFQSFIDDEYLVDILNSFSRSETVLVEKNRIMNKNEYIYLAWDVRISESKLKGTEDLTNEFRSILRLLEQNGYNIIIQNDGSNIDENQIKINRGIFIKIDESGDLKNKLNYISLILIQNESQKLSDEKIAKFHNWFGYESDEKGIYFEMSIEDLAYLMLNRSEHDRGGYVDLLTNGIDIDNYDSIYYQPDVSELINHQLNNNQLEKLIKCLINEVGLDDIISEISDISGESLEEESEITQFLIKERFKNTLEELLKNNDLEIVGEIQEIIADYNVVAHVSQNGKEMYKEFDRILDKEGIDFRKEFKLGKRFYYTKSKIVDRVVKTYYDDYIWIYKIYYDDRWISEYDQDQLENSNLESIFNVWANSEYFNYRLDPYYSDYVNVDDKSLNSEIDSMLDDCLKED